MRRLFVLLAFCLSCGDDPGAISRGNDPPEITHQISGIVEDSVLNLAIRGVRVRIGDSLVVSDSQGHFMVVHRAGTFTLTVDDVGYERYGIPLNIYQDGATLKVRLQGQAPYLLSCTFETDLLTATIVDLQGRKTINRRSQSTITLVSNETSVLRDAYSWYFTPVDNLTWLAHVPLAGVVADTAVWRLEDSDGYARTSQCVKQPPPCSSCAAKR
jgi:hypothetical protein